MPNSFFTDQMMIDKIIVRVISNKMSFSYGPGGFYFKTNPFVGSNVIYFMFFFFFFAEKPLVWLNKTV